MFEKNDSTTCWIPWICCLSAKDHPFILKLVQTFKDHRSGDSYGPVSVCFCPWNHFEMKLKPKMMMFEPLFTNFLFQVMILWIWQSDQKLAQRSSQTWAMATVPLLRRTWQPTETDRSEPRDLRVRVISFNILAESSWIGLNFCFRCSSTIFVDMNIRANINYIYIAEQLIYHYVTVWLNHVEILCRSWSYTR